MSVIIEDGRLIRYEGGEICCTVSEGIRSIEDLAFSGAERLERLLIPESVESIGNYAFRMCYALQSVLLPRCVSHFGSGVFQHCWNLKSVRLPEGTETIGTDMFESCHELTSISLPGTVKSIARSAFSGCRNLRVIDAEPNQISLLPPAARYIAVISYMEKNADGGGNEIIDGFVSERQKNLLDLAVNRRSAEAVRYMLSRGLVSDDAVREYLARSAERSRIEITALLLDHSRQSGSGTDILGEDPFL